MLKLVLLLLVLGIAAYLYDNAVFNKKLKKGLNRKTLRGDFVQSYGEEVIANFLYSNNIEYVYDKPCRFGFFQTRSIRPDFYLPGYDIYIEYWGMMSNKEYARKKDWKESIYKKYKKLLINLYTEQVRVIPDILKERLKV